MAVTPLDDLRTKPVETKVVEDRSQENQLGRDAFLKIFIAQLGAQDPLNPQDSTQLSSQLAQFSQLEQTLQSTATLGKIGDKLDELIELGKGQNSGLDPVGLIGKTIDFPADELTVPGAGASSPLEIAVSGSLDSTALLVQVEEIGGDAHGLLQLSAQRSADGSIPTLPPGTYTLRFENGEPVVFGPEALQDLGVSVTPFQQLRENEDGEFELDTETNAPFQFSSGRRYRFSVRAADANVGSTPVDLDLTRSAQVTSVRLKDGSPLVIAGGAEVDPARIQSIR
jgi:flagellar hook assembly protein FlgD